MHEFSPLTSTLERAPRPQAMAADWPRALEGDNVCLYFGFDESATSARSRRPSPWQPLQSKINSKT